MQDHYRINVSLNGRHFFATAPNSVTSLDQAELVAREIRARFPATEGFLVTVTHWQSRGTEVAL